MSLTISTASTCTATHIIVMGVSGCGKTTIGMELAARLGWPFFDADDFHPAENIAKMKEGQPLDDLDRAPWLASLNALLHTHPHAVLACSALKEKYRIVLETGLPEVRFVHPHGAFEIIARRMEARSKKTGHYMPTSLLKSQFETLEFCQNALMINLDMPSAERANHILLGLSHSDVTAQK